MKNSYFKRLGTHRSAVLDLYPSDSSMVRDLGADLEGEVWWISRVNVPAEFRGQGVGSSLLQQALEDADLEEVSLVLEIVPYGDLTYEHLRDWYERNGFQEVEDSGVFLRLPGCCVDDLY